MTLVTLHLKVRYPEPESSIGDILSYMFQLSVLGAADFWTV